MEEFKKWTNKSCLKARCNKSVPCDTCEQLQKEGWRAAMEYMLTVSDNKCCFVDCIVHKAIEKELEDASEN